MKSFTINTQETLFFFHLRFLLMGLSPTELSPKKTQTKAHRTDPNITTSWAFSPNERKPVEEENHPRPPRVRMSSTQWTRVKTMEICHPPAKLKRLEETPTNGASPEKNRSSRTFFAEFQDAQRIYASKNTIDIDRSLNEWKERESIGPRKLQNRRSKP